MAKEWLAKGKMEAACRIEEMRGWCREIIQRRSHGWGDQENAMRRVETEFGIGYWQQWNLLNRPPKRVDMGLYLKLRSALLSAIENAARNDMARLQKMAAVSHDATDLESLEAEARNLLADIQAKKEAVTPTEY